MSATVTLTAVGKWMLLSGAYAWGQSGLVAVPVSPSPPSGVGNLPGSSGVYAPVTAQYLGHTTGVAFYVERSGDFTHLCCSGLTVRAHTNTTSAVTYTVGPAYVGVSSVHVRPLLSLVVEYSAAMPGVLNAPYDITFSDNIVAIL